MLVRRNSHNQGGGSCRLHGTNEGAEQQVQSQRNTGSTMP